MLNLQGLKKADINYNACTKSKIMRRPTKGPLADPLQCLDSIKGDTFELKPKAHNKSFIMLLLIDQKTRYRWAFLLINKAGPIIFNAIKSFFKRLKN